LPQCKDFIEIEAIQRAQQLYLRRLILLEQKKVISTDSIKKNNGDLEGEQLGSR
jgi:hypothetical protein